MAPFHQLFTLLSGGEHVARPLQKDRRESREDSKEQERWRRRNDVRRFKLIPTARDALRRRVLMAPMLGLSQPDGKLGIRRLMLEERCQCR